MKRLLIATVVAAGLLAWVLAVALQWPFVAWFAYATWAVLGVGLSVRMFRRPREAARASLDASEQVQNIYLGRKPPTMYPSDPAASSQYGDALEPDPLDLPERD